MSAKIITPVNIRGINEAGLNFLLSTKYAWASAIAKRITSERRPHTNDGTWSCVFISKRDAICLYVETFGGYWILRPKSWGSCSEMMRILKPIISPVF